MYLKDCLYNNVRVWAALMLLFSSVTFASEISDVNEASSASHVEKFVEDYVLSAMEKHRVAGTTIAMVRNGKLTYAQGFGFSDISEKEKVDVKRTLFRWGSVSKTLTWTAILQLYEKGKISLDADINTYLTDVTIPDTFSEPIRVRDLLAHTTGFEDLIVGHIFEKDTSQVMPLTDYLNRFKPERVRPPGQIFSYSNYGTALAGQIVANVSQMSFEDYVERNIFSPLDMNRSTFREPLPESFEETMKPELIEWISKSFSPKEQGFKQIDHFTFLSSIGPAGAMSSTAIDMAKFAQAHLQKCKNLLNEETCLMMRKPQLSMTSVGDFSVNHGFFHHKKIGGHTRFGHNGGTDYFHSEMGIYPDLDFAIVISSNTTTGKDFNKDIESAIVKFLFGEIKSPALDKSAADSLSSDINRFVGTYINTRRPQSNIEVLYALTLPTITVSKSSDSELLIESNGSLFKAEHIRSNLFVDSENDRHFEFEEDKFGNITYLKSLRTYERVDAYQAPGTRVLMLLITLFLIVVIVLINLVLSMKRFVRREFLQHKNSRKLILLCGSLWLVFIVFLSLAIVHDLGEYTYPYDFPSFWVKAALAFGVLTTLASFMPVYAMLNLWREKETSLIHRIFYSIQVAVVVIFIAQLHAVHLIGFNYF